MRFVHIADVHLGMSFKSASFGKSFGSKKRAGIMKNLKAVIQHIKENHIELLLIAGDFLEGDYVELSDLLDVKYLFESIPDTSIVLMAGNHDPMSKENNPYNLVQWPNHVYLMKTDYTSIELEPLKLSVIGVSWDSKGPLTLNKDKLEVKIKEAQGERKILMLHGDVYSPSDYLYMDANYLKTLGVDYIALGHIHKPDIIKDNIVYPGSLEALDFSENYSHGFIQGHIGQGNLSFSHVESMALPMLVIKVDISACQAYLEIMDKIKDEILENPRVKQLSNIMIRLQLEGEKNPYIGDIESKLLSELKELLSSQIAYIELKDKTVPGYDLQVLYSEHEDDLIGHFIRSMKEKGLEDEVNNQALLTGISLLLEVMR